MKNTTTQEETMTSTTLSNSVRIAACISRMTSDGMTLRNAIKQTSHALDISEAAVCHALTVAQDFASDLKAIQT